MALHEGIAARLRAYQHGKILTADLTDEIIAKVEAKTIERVLAAVRELHDRWDGDIGKGALKQAESVIEGVGDE